MLHKDDPELLNAVQVLADAVRRERIPGVVEFRQLEDALKEIGAEPDDTRWATADAAFNALDPDLRQRVADRAQQLAYKEAKVRREGVGPVAAKPPAAAPVPASAAAPAADATTASPTTKQQTTQKTGASPFLSALNRGRLGARK